MSQFIPFFTTPNLVDGGMTEAHPWEFAPSPAELAEMQRLPKTQRPERMSKKDTIWNIYSAVGGVCRTLRIGKDNTPARLRGLVVDYDMNSTLDMVQHYLAQSKSEFRPNYIEFSLSNNVRLVWVFEREALVSSLEECHDLITNLLHELKAPLLLPGYDANSAKPSQVWTNGGRWHLHHAEPLSWEAVFTMLLKVSTKLDNARAEVPLEKIEEEVRRRYPGRWQGPFELNALGVRFWDESADNPKGCRVKPDGMQCFTGRVPFKKWTEIFGAAWVQEQRVLHMGKAAGDIHFDGRHYWDLKGDRWCSVCREDVILGLKAHGISSKARRGQVASDAEQVLHHIQNVNRVDGAGPIINQRPGVVQVDGRRILNISTLRALEPAAKEAVTPEDFSWTWRFLKGLFDCPDMNPLGHFLAWLRRAYIAAREYRRLMGQAVFLCGPRENGKTLLAYRYIRPMLGGKWANPYDHFTGATDFNDDLFESPLLAINDEEATTREEARQKFLARLKSFVVNPAHTYHPKFCSRVTVEWTGRIFVTLNDDPSSVGLLPEVNDNTADKLMFFGSRPYEGTWDSGEVLEARIETELPFFARWLLNWTPPDDVLAPGRMGVKSFHDPRILDLSRQQNYSYNLLEALRLWCRQGCYWDEANGSRQIWEGTPLELLNQFAVAPMDVIAKEWNTNKLAKSLAALARSKGLGVECLDHGERRFRITREHLLKSRSTKASEKRTPELARP